MSVALACDCCGARLFPLATGGYRCDCGHFTPDPEGAVPDFVPDEWVEETPTS